MHKYSPEIVQEYRLKLSLNPTIYELQLEQKLLLWKIPYEKQKPILASNRLYYLDFFLPTYNSYIEVDGGYHNTYKQSKTDCKRFKHITTDHNYKEIRLPNKSIAKLTKESLIQLLTQEQQPIIQKQKPRKKPKKRTI